MAMSSLLPAPSQEMHNNHPRLLVQAASCVPPQESSRAGHTRPNNPRPFVTGYLRYRGKYADNHQGAQLNEILKMLNIDIETAPPFEAATARASFSSHGVVKITNIPFTVTNQEINQFIARFTNIPLLKKNVQGWPVHIIMEKPTGKTMDCFVEFPSHEAARECVRTFEFTALPGKNTKIGSRNVNLDLSDQAELMKAVFPRARLVIFNGITGRPRILSRDHDPSWTEGFRGFFTAEELFGIIRFAENPSRSPFVQKCQQRVYESMITTLYKFPWAATQTYTIAARNSLFEAVCKQLRVLSKRLSMIPPANNTHVVPYNCTTSWGLGHSQAYSFPDSPDSNGSQYDPREVGLSQNLLLDLLFAALNVPAFSLSQKFELCQTVEPLGRGVGLSYLAQHWPFQSISPAENVSDDVTQFWLQLFDSGFDLLEKEGGRTSFEVYMLVGRNEHGFPCTLLTKSGLELPMGDAHRIELGVMMVYVARGRLAWANDRGITIQQWHIKDFTDLMQTIAREQAAGVRFGIAEPRPHLEDDRNISPTTPALAIASSVAHDSATDLGDRATHIGPRDALSFMDQYQDAYSDTGRVASLVSSEPSHPAVTQEEIARSKFNPATVKEFVPSSVQPRTSSEPALGNLFSVAKNIWSQAPAEVPVPNRYSQPSVTSEHANTPISQVTPSSEDSHSFARPIITAFRDPFGPPSATARGFNSDFRRPSTDVPQAHDIPGRRNAVNDTSFTGSIPTGPRSTSLQSPFGRRGSSRGDSVAHAMRQLSFGTKSVSHNNSVDKARASFSAAIDPFTTSSTGRTPSSSTESYSCGAPSFIPPSSAVQKYPNVTYTTVPVRSDYSGLNPTSGHNHSQHRYNPRRPSHIESSHHQAQPASQFPTVKVRAQSTPFAAHTHHFDCPADHESPISFADTVKRGSLPITTVEFDDTVLNDPQDGAEASGFRVSVNSEGGVQLNDGEF